MLNLINKSKLLLLLSAVTSGLFVLQSCNSNDNVVTREIISTVQDRENPEVTIPEGKPDPLAEFDLEQSERLTNTAKLLAGIKPEENQELAQLGNTPAWQSHQNTLASSWSKLDSQQISKVKQWSAQELKEINADRPTVFYPFSGPDFLYSYSLFPEAKEMVMVGLEPIGSIPDLNSLDSVQFDSKLQEVRNSLSAILQFSFFRTNDMKVDLQQQGVLPVLYVFMARTNNRLLDVDYIGLDAEANIQPLTEGLIPGVKISFVPEGKKEPRTLYYFSTDLSDEGIAKNPQVAKFVAKLDNPVTYLKAASYLMYYDGFSKIKDLALTNSSYLLQDDSGMPVSSFDNQKWNLEFYGNYTTPIALFSNRYQPELRQIYSANQAKIKPLDFGIGYQFQVNTSNLMLAKAKENSALKSE